MGWTGLALVYAAEELDTELSLSAVVDELDLAYVALLLYEAEDPAYEAGGGGDYALVLAPSLVVHYRVKCVY